MNISLRNAHHCAFALIALASIGCGGDDGKSPSSPITDGGAHDATTSTPIDGSTNVDATVADATTPAADAGGGADIPTYNGCSAADYVDMSADSADRTIQVGKMGLSFTPKCMTIAKGQTITWSGALTTHPLAAGNSDHPDAGTLPSPILETATGTSVSFAFPNSGTYPYYCEVHGFGDGQGMSGSVHVK